MVSSVVSNFIPFYIKTITIISGVDWWDNYFL
jgi:hypothetical protein